MRARVVITSFGFISSLGNTPEDVFMNLKKDSTQFTTKTFANKNILICPVNNFDPGVEIPKFKNRRYLNRGSAFAVAAALRAFHASKMEHGQLESAGLFVGAGPNFDIEGEFSWNKERMNINWDQMSPLWILRFLPNTAQSAISQLLSIHGPNLTLGNACAASLQAIGEAWRKISQGEITTALVAGGDSRLSTGGILSYDMARALLGDETTYAPFDKKRHGLVPGEGGAAFILEELEQAKARGAQILGEIKGYADSLDGSSMTAIGGEIKWAQKAVKEALQLAGLSPKDIGTVFAHGTGTLLNDEMEVNLIRSIFYTETCRTSTHPTHPTVTALKSWVGHTSAACGAVELALILCCMQKNILPPIRNLETPCCEDILFQKVANQQIDDTDNMNNMKNVVLQNFGFGGQNAVLVLGR